MFVVILYVMLMNEIFLELLRFWSDGIETEIYDTGQVILKDEIGMCTYFRFSLRCLFLPNSALCRPLLTAHQEQNVKTRVHSQHSPSSPRGERRVRWPLV